MKYYIEDITYKTGETRTDGRYPNRIGSTVEFLDVPTVGKPIHFRYIKYNNDEHIEDHMPCTSRVNDYDEYSHPGYLYIYTRNSIYKFKEISED
jgi:hypothetical protein